MTTRRITRLPDDYERGNAGKELDINSGVLREGIELTEEFMELSSEGSYEAQEIVLDWAMAIRHEENLPWAECIRAASIFYFG